MGASTTGGSSSCDTNGYSPNFILFLGSRAAHESGSGSSSSGVGMGRGTAAGERVTAGEGEVDCSLMKAATGPS